MKIVLTLIAAIIMITSCNGQTVQPARQPPIQLLVFRVGGYYGTTARHSLCTTFGLLRSTPNLPHTVGIVALHAHFFLCTQELAELHQAQPMGYLRHRHNHCRTLQLRHLSGTHQRIYRLYADGNLDTPNYHLWSRSLFRDGSSKRK